MLPCVIIKGLYSNWFIQVSSASKTQLTQYLNEERKIYAEDR